MVMIDAAVKAMRDGRNQYPPGPGIPRAASGHFRPISNGSTVLAYDPDTEVLVTAGATEAIAAAALRALCEPGDEVVMFEPYYDSYALAALAMAGSPTSGGAASTPRGGASTSRIVWLPPSPPTTRLVLLELALTTPTGKVFPDPDELAAIARGLRRGRRAGRHRRGLRAPGVRGASPAAWASFPGMRERTITISSAWGKTFSFTGWKIGWACGPAPLVAAVRTAKQFLTYVSGAPLEPAVAVGLGLPDQFFSLVRSADQLPGATVLRGLDDAGFDVLRPGCYLLRHDRHSPLRPGEGRGGLLSSAPRSAAGWWRYRRRCSTTTKRPVAVAGPLRLLQAP